MDIPLPPSQSEAPSSVPLPPLGSDSGSFGNTENMPSWPADSTTTMGGDGGLPPLAPRWWKTRWAIGVFVGAGVVLIAGGVSAWWFIARETPVKVLAQAMSNAKSIESFHSVMNVTARFEAGAPVGIERVDVVVEGDSSYKSAQDTKQAFTSTVRAKFGSTSPLSVYGLNDVSLGFEARLPSLGKAYVRITQLPSIGVVNIEPLKNIWIELPTTPPAAFGALSSSIPTADLEKLSKTVKALQDAWTTLDIAEGISDLGLETVNNVSTHHYQIQLTPVQMLALAKTMVAAAEISITDTDWLSIKDQFDAIGNLPIEVWVGEDDYYVYRTRLNSKINSPIGAITLTMDQTMSRWNQPVTVQTPTDAQPIEQVLGGIMSAVNPAQQPLVPPSAAPDGDFDGLPDDQERAIGADPFKADTDGDGIIDGDEVNKYRTNALKIDTDGDGLGDSDEVLRWKTDPIKADTDGDGYPDAQEIKNGYNPVGDGKLTPEQKKLVP